MAFLAPPPQPSRPDGCGPSVFPAASDSPVVFLTELYNSAPTPQLEVYEHHDAAVGSFKPLTACYSHMLKLKQEAEHHGAGELTI